MAKKPRSQRRGGNNKSRKKGGGGDDEEGRGGGAGSASADFLSDSHTILDLSSVATSNNGGTSDSLNGFIDDDNWDIDDHDDDKWLGRVSGGGGNEGGASSSANTTSEDVVQQRQQQLHDSLSLAEDDFSTEKRTTKRLQILKQWFSLLSRHALPQYYETTVLKFLEPLVVESCCKTSLLKGSPQEQYASLRVLEVVACLVSTQPLYEETIVKSRLLRTVQSTYRAVPVRALALRAMSMFVVCMDDGDMAGQGSSSPTESSEQLLELCEEIIMSSSTTTTTASAGKARGGYRGQFPTPSGLVATALQVWCFVASQSLGAHKFPSNISGGSEGRGLKLLPALVKIFDPHSTAGSVSEKYNYDDHDVEDEEEDEAGVDDTPGAASAASTNDTEGRRQLLEAAGLTAAFIHDCRLRSGVGYGGGGRQSQSQTETIDVDGDATATTTTATTTATAADPKFTKGNWDDLPQHQDMIDELTQQLYELAHTTSHHLSKARKKQQRSVFRDYWHTLQDDRPCVEETLTFRGGTLCLNTWQDLIAIQMFRKCLQSGLQHQILHCQSVQTVLGASGQTLNNIQNSHYSSLEKRLLWSQSSEASKQKDLDLKKQRNKRRNIQNHFLNVDE
eukprot:CAMPEP_0113465264 /NCGR_PEP_ID=MMETSP0014_2-20120614/13646_1 /TAXON_ID=2857 /ORGANISM="Nitzschia sp." /LENGTH=618 /DNA_ID=CAMNT_0000357409 /DNA_START=86 /DNA_END=1942 /DNA_ORIENTATION=+ /assembly_acc=CAM_ASM_000159